MAIVESSAATPVSNWLQIAGTAFWDFTNAPRYGGSAEPTGFGLLLSDLRLRDGSVTVSVRFEEDVRGSTAGIVLGYDPESQRYVVVGRGGQDRLYAAYCPGADAL